MARILEPLTEEELKSTTAISVVKREYLKLSGYYKKMADGSLSKCPKCDEWLNTDQAFYNDKNYKSGKFPICKKCLLDMIEQRRDKNDNSHESKESVQKVLQMMDLPYIDSFYENCVQNAENGVKERNRKSPWATYITALISLPNWKGMKWADSDFGTYISDQDDFKVVQKTIKAGKKRFGQGYSDADYMFLEDEYQDWVTRYECNTKAQEKIFQRLSFKAWEIDKATRSGLSTKDLDKTYQELLSSINILPKQNSSSGISDTLTFGQLIEKWENDDPIPEPDPELADVDGIGKKLRVFFSGHLSRVLGFDNGYSKEYDEYMDQYTVKKPEYNGVSENGDMTIYNQLFGKTDGD